VTGFSIDTRTLRPGELFVALKTEKRDGHEFLADAEARGAVAALVSRAVEASNLPQLVVTDPKMALQQIARAHRETFAQPVIGVTGSAGKTSTKNLLSVLLGGSPAVLATEGNLNNHLGVPLTLLRLDGSKHRFAVVEAGISGTDEMAVIAPLIAPTMAVITTIGAAHLDRLGSIAEVAAEKSVLAKFLRPGGLVVLPDECLVFDAIAQLPCAMVVAVSQTQESNPHPGDHRIVRHAIHHESDYTRLSLTLSHGVRDFEINKTTTGMAENAVLAIAVAMELGITCEQIDERIREWHPASLRGEVRTIDGRIVYLDCYNANPSSMDDALEGFLACTPSDSPRLFVVGSMEELGPRAGDFHRAAGRRWPLGKGDRLIVFGTHAEALAEGARIASPNGDIVVNPEREDAARVLREFPGAVFLKGSRRYALENLLGDLVPGDKHTGEVAA
jgi:UDP-N-acetylmuramoyl-tripeptide--D-alanyl-D-alanine ligase